MAQTTVPRPDTAFQALRDAQRRRLLVALVDQAPSGESVRVPDDVLTGERDPERVRTEMFHKHLPKLESAGYVRWDRDTLEVERGPAFDEIRPVIGYVSDHSEELADGRVTTE